MAVLLRRSLCPVPDGEEPIQLGTGPVRMPDYLRPTYANYVGVNHSPWDFRLTFGIVRAPLPGPELEAAQERGNIEPEAVAEIILPANLMASFLTVLRQNFDRYMEAYGVPGMDRMEPGQE
jgi:uncharacterized protein DUF3467